jgi:hypothetical protein
MYSVSLYAVQILAYKFNAFVLKSQFLFGKKLMQESQRLNHLEICIHMYFIKNAEAGIAQ